MSDAARHRAAPRRERTERPTVFVVWDDHVSALAANALVETTALASGAWTFEIAERSGDPLLERLLTSRDAGVLLIDIETCAQLGVDELRRLRRRRPEVEWLVTLDQASARDLQLLIASEAKGCIPRDSDLERLQRAVGAVLQGEVWFPRSVSTLLYLALLAPRMEAELLAHQSPVSQAAVAAALSAREVEVMVLMRRGFSNKEIAARLQISVNTVKKHVSHALEKRGLHKRRQSFDL